ncbi:beta-glucosidase family protein [Tenggerimyces flavus]|uniref:Beta-glucosidase n=1 Tax=Tenggerimyces flavus TaxID=1708749 RepID=A0ABV7YI75_9ACTN|nr:glycoside hydrolase family 3 C-terminal domain-containing protein [Tenggerimyces flavus]MBM7784546.1 beta-glucosidase [Tenggerimyces flavus]
MVRKILLAGALALALVPTTMASASPTTSHEPGRVERLLSKLTLDEKLSFVHGLGDPHSMGQSGYLPGVPRLGIPEVRMADGAAGIRVNEPATSMPAPVMLASAFDANLAKKYGAAVGRDGKALGMDVLLGPTTGVIRMPYGGRNFESFSEDPLVSANTVVGHLTGVQSQGVIATTKHYAENNQEANRDGLNVKVGEQALREIELPAFEAAAKAGSGAFMCSYNKVNGTQSCQNDDVLKTILKEEWGFRGRVMSDWEATHSTDSIVHGLDMEMPEGKFMADKLEEAIEKGDLPISALNASVTRILKQYERFGLLDHKPRPKRDQEGNARVAKQVAEQGAVLLKNDRGTLPLKDNDDSIAVIGPTAKTPKFSGGGSGKGNPVSVNAPIDTIAARAGKDRVTYAPGGDLFGAPIPEASLEPKLPMEADGTIGLNPIEPYVGKLTVPEDGDYRVSIRPGPDQLVQLYVDDRNTIGGAYGLGDLSLAMHLAKGQHDLVILPIVGPKPSKMKLGMVTPDETAELIQDAAAVAKQSDQAVVFVYDEESEGADRPGLGLTAYQDDLVSQVAKANPHTTVVLNTCSAISMPWLKGVRAVLDLYYPGEQGAEATAALLFGDVAPGGRLTQTFPASEQQTPVAGDPKRYPGVNKEVDYAEGIEVGYRWYDNHGVKPLFPFGHGLTYTSFDYRHLSVARNPFRGGLEVSLTVRNTGKRAGKAVPQIYLGASPNVQAQQAKRKLVGYQAITLRPGETRRVRIHVDQRQLEYWNAGKHGWQLGTGKRTFHAASSSADLPLTATVQVR